MPQSACFGERSECDIAEKVVADYHGFIDWFTFDNTSPENLQNMLMEADDLYENHAHKQSIQKYHAIITQYKDKPYCDRLKTATIYNNIAGVYHDQCDYDTAWKLSQKALKICEMKLGEQHPTTIAVRDQLQRIEKKMCVSL